MRPIATTNDQQGYPPPGKLSPEFSARLARLKPKQKIRAVVLLRSLERNGKVVARDGRQAAVGNIRSYATATLPEIDGILARFNGRRLSEQPSALGTIAIEATAAAISALAECDHVKAILEDQPISLVR